jgi:hypothetical protein
MAVTAVAVSAELEPYQLVPVALVIAAAKAATSHVRSEARLAVESELTDSVSGEPLAPMVRGAKGIEIEEMLTLDLAKPRIDGWAKSVQESLSARLRRDGEK